MTKGANYWLVGYSEVAPNGLPGELGGDKGLEKWFSCRPVPENVSIPDSRRHAVFANRFKVGGKSFTDPIGTCLLQLVTSPNAHAEACGLEPKTNDKCACLCAISPNFEGCMKDGKDGCLSNRFDPVEVCQCLCDKGHQNGSLNWVEWKACKYFCKKGGK